MRRWERHWSVTIHWDQAKHSPWGTTRYQTNAATPRELRQLIEAARHDPHVTSFPYHPVQVLVGDALTHCRVGHRYEPGRRVDGGLIEGWAPCSCGGHHIRVCPDPDCQYPRVADPPLLYDCDAKPIR